MNTPSNSIQEDLINQKDIQSKKIIRLVVIAIITILVCLCGLFSFIVVLTFVNTTEHQSISNMSIINSTDKLKNNVDNNYVIGKTIPPISTSFLDSLKSKKRLSPPSDKTNILNSFGDYKIFNYGIGKPAYTVSFAVHPSTQLFNYEGETNEIHFNDNYSIELSLYYLNNNEFDSKDNVLTIILDKIKHKYLETDDNIKSNSQIEIDGQLWNRYLYEDRMNVNYSSYYHVIQYTELGDGILVYVMCVDLLGSDYSFFKDGIEYVINDIYVSKESIDY